MSAGTHRFKHLSRPKKETPSPLRPRQLLFDLALGLSRCCLRTNCAVEPRFYDLGQSLEQSERENFACSF